MSYFVPDVLSCIHLWLFATKMIVRCRISSNVVFLVRILSRLKIFRVPRWLTILELFREVCASNLNLKIRIMMFILCNNANFISVS